LVKRITKINGFTTNPNDGTVLTGASSDTDTNNPGVANWPVNYINGKINAGVVKPSDTIEYTIYFLNNQGADVSGIKICDPIRGIQDYVPDSLKLNLSITGTVTSDVGLTDIVDPTVDRANSFSKTDPLPTGCNISAATSAGADNGGIAIDVTGTTGIPALTVVPGAITTPATPPSYGLFRFTTQVKP
jgi:uncharacterized repeat protein (TIGR01451 family)